VSNPASLPPAGSLRYLPGMSMRWDPLVAAALARELDERLRRARVRRLHLDGEARRVHLFLRDATLVLEMHPTAGWVSLMDAAEPFPDARPLATTVHGVRAIPDESALVLGLRRVRGRGEGVELVAEWVGNRWNALVVGHRSRVIRHVLVPRRERTRVLEVGSTWEPPPATGREGRDGALSRERWDALLEAAGDDPEARRRTLLRSVAWTSSINVERFLGPDGWEAWRDALNPAGWRPRLVQTPRGPQPYPVPLSPFPETGAESLAEAMARARESSTGAPARDLLLPADLLDRASVRLERARRKAAGLRRQLEGTDDPDAVRALGDLILARYGEIPAGTARVRLRDFEGNEVALDLDPALPPHENAKRHYDEAARIERARAELPRRIRAAEEEEARWTGLVERLRSGEADPGEVARLLGPEGTPRGRGAGAARSALPYRAYRSSGGLEIRVGRGARSNDDLTFRHSSPDDVWLHVRQAPGAHVILRWGRRENPPRRDLVEAAVMAALHSEARGSGSVPVDWTRRKHVRKPRKAAPGAVIPDRVETVFVAPDPALPERLAAGDERA
jgi:predicted ribosome quality control (RQC) complex YloA/Tae2 family protein